MVFKQSSVFKRGGIQKLDFEYVPSRLPHREEYLEKLVKFFKVAIDQPGMLSERILISGESGTGKTATAKKVGNSLERIARNRGVDLIYAQINCRTTSGKFGLVQNIIRQAAPTLPLRGYGPIELLHALWDYLNEHNKFLILTLDEIDYYLRRTGEDIVYDLTRLTDAITNVPQRINFMFIARDHSFMRDMSQETLSRFRPQERLEFPPYLEDQLLDILKERVKEAFRENAVSDEIITFIARNTARYGNGDARYALLLLLSAGFAADRDKQSSVLPEHVREAQEKTDPKIRDEDVTMLTDDEKLVLLALARHLKTEKEAIFLPLEEVETSYHIVCEEYDVEPVGRVMLHALVKQLKAANLITLNEKFEPGLNGVKAEVLEKFLADLLKRQEFHA
jgi:archaeal cell division control protein 6